MNAQAIQDKIFRKMSADKKLEIVCDMNEFVRDGEKYHQIRADMIKRSLDMENDFHNKMLKYL